MKVSLFETFTSLFTLKKTEFVKFREFFDKSLKILYLLQDKQLNEKLLKHLTQYEHYCCNLQSLNLIEFLHRHTPQSNEFLETLKLKDTFSKEISKLLNKSSSSSSDVFAVDQMLIQELIEQKPQSNALYMDIEQVSKRPRIEATISSSNIQKILNDMKQNSQTLLNHKSFDAKDFELLNEIKHNIDKCLTDFQ